MAERFYGGAVAGGTVGESGFMARVVFYEESVFI
jgi:hypothetical protein